MSENVRIKSQKWFNDHFYPVVKTVFSYRMFNGKWSNDLTRDTVHRGDIVCVIPYDKVTDEVILIEQFRIAAYLEGAGKNSTGVIWETVSGYVDEGEDIEDAALRELWEECGLTCVELVSLGSVLTNPGMCDERLHLFYASVLAKHDNALFGVEEEGEQTRVRVVKRDKAMEMVQTGLIDKAGAQLALYRLNDCLLKKRKGAPFTGDGSL